MEEINALIKSYIAHPAGAAVFVIIILWFASNEQRKWMSDLDEGHEVRLLRVNRKDFKETEEFLRYIAHLTKRQLYFTHAIYLMVVGVLTWSLIMFLADQ